MTGFTSLPHYSPVVVLLLGLLTFGGCLGCGLILAGRLSPSLESPYRPALGALLGTLVLSLAVQLLAMAGWARPLILKSLWVSFAAAGAAACWLEWRRPRDRAHSPEWPDLIFWVIAGFSLAVNLLVSLAPSTKIDELYYHMVVPGRIVLDGGLRFYRFPIEAALPQTHYQIAQAPLHALGYPDAPNVLSLCLGATLCWFVWRRLACLDCAPVAWAAAIAAGLYPAVWYVTAGAHAFGDLAIVLAVALLMDWDALKRRVSPSGLASALSIALVAAVASKLSLGVIAGGLLLCGGWRLLRDRERGRFGVLTSLLFPWLLFYVPLLVWAHFHSGSPFGPALAGRFGESAYDPAQAAQWFAGSRMANQVTVAQLVRLAALNYSPLVWVGAFGCCAAVAYRRFAGKGAEDSEAQPQLSACSRSAWSTLELAVCLFGLQALLIYRFLPQDPRFLGGLHLALLLGFAVMVAPALCAKVGRRLWATAMLALLLPWSALQIYYAHPFIAVVLGMESRERFYDRYLAFFRDFEELERILPKDSVLFNPGFRLDSIYAPRPIYTATLEDIPPGRRPVYWFHTSGSTQVSNPDVPEGYELGEMVYENQRAIIACYRTPGRAPAVGRLQVYRLRKKESRSQPVPDRPASTHG